MTGQNVVATIEQPGSSAVAPRQAITPMEMLQIAVEQGADLDKLTKLMDLQERWEANEARKAFVAAVAEFKADPPKVTRNKHVRYETSSKKDTEYDHATLDNVIAAIGPAMSRCGLSHRWETQQLDGGMIRVTCVLTHVMGHSERTTLQGGADQSGGKNNIQAIGSTVTYLQRYTLLAAVGLAATDADSDGRSPVEFISAEQKEELVALLKETGADVARFLAYLRVSALDDLPAPRFAEAKAALEKKRGAK